MSIGHGAGDTVFLRTQNSGFHTGNREEGRFEMPMEGPGTSAASMSGTASHGHAQHLFRNAVLGDPGPTETLVVDLAAGQS